MRVFIYILHHLPCSSILQYKKALCCCRSSFASRKTSCTYTSSVRGDFPEPVLFSLAMVKDAFHPSPIYDPLVTQDLASLQEDASRRRPGSLIAFLAEHEVTQLIYGARLFLYRLQTKASHLPAVVTFNSCSCPR